MSKAIRRLAAATHGTNSKHFDYDLDIKDAITSLLWIAQGKPEKATLSYPKAKALVEPLAALGIKKGWYYID